MKSYKHKYGVTLVEMLIVLAIIALLTSMVIGIAGRISNQSKEQLTRNTFALLNAALEQFRDYEYNYPPPYSDFDFPLDCNDLLESNLETALGDALGNASGPAVVTILPIDAVFNHLPEYSQSEALYFFLNRVPESRKTLGKIDSSLITNRDDDGNRMKIAIDIGGVVRVYPLLRVIDPWGETLRYSYYDGVVLRTFPVITSAGPDKNFNTPDDITSR